jgi:putative hemolysin
MCLSGPEVAALIADELSNPPNYPVSPELIPALAHADRRYAVDFARSAGELGRVQRLRFEVFNLELGEGLESSYASGKDEDPFDPVCHHLMVTDRCTGRVVGTYRMQTGEMAEGTRGFYSAEEFRLHELPRELLRDSVEIGRACVAENHRKHKVLFLLWRGLAAYLVHNRKRHLFGCCSLTSQDPVQGRRVMDFLAREGHVHPEYRIGVRDGWACDPAKDQRVSAATGPRVRLPKLFRIYLRYGARVCSEPALDRSFKTIDYLVLLSLENLDPHSRRMFFGSSLP